MIHVTCDSCGRNGIVSRERSFEMPELKRCRMLFFEDSKQPPVTAWNVVAPTDQRDQNTLRIDYAHELFWFDRAANIAQKVLLPQTQTSKPAVFPNNSSEVAQRAIQRN